MQQLYDHGYFFMQKKLRPRPRLDPAPSVPDAILFMKKRDELVKRLPDLNCCVCGSPSCETFAEDVLTGHVELQSCPFIDNGQR